MAIFPSILRNKLIGKPAKSELVLDGRTLPVTLRYNQRAKRIILRMDKTSNGIILTVPSGTSHAKAMDFAASQGGWIWQQLAKQPQIIPFASGQIIPVRGELYLITASNNRRTPVWIENNGEYNSENKSENQNLLMVSGASEHHARRVKDWLKKQARADLSKATYFYAEKMGGKVARISIRDTASRWGSCSSNGSLSFSWRLIFAPAFVLDYVAAHEAAHLIEMNHSANFWHLVETHCPATKQAKKWLKANGRSLHKYGPNKK